jgi:hypothetical protein
MALSIHSRQMLALDHLHHTHLREAEVGVCLSILEIWATLRNYSTLSSWSPTKQGAITLDKGYMKIAPTATMME